MSQGAQTSAEGAQGQEGGMGAGLLGTLFSSPGQKEMLSQLLQDPKTLQMFADVAKHLGRTVEAGNKVPAHIASSIIQSASSPQQDQQSQSNGPYLGDIQNFSPAQAQAVLQSLGIPGGFSPTVEPFGQSGAPTGARFGIRW